MDTKSIIIVALAVVIFSTASFFGGVVFTLVNMPAKPEIKEPTEIVLVNEAKVLRINADGTISDDRGRVRDLFSTRGTGEQF